MLFAYRGTKRGRTIRIAFFSLQGQNLSGDAEVLQMTEGSSLLDDLGINYLLRAIKSRKRLAFIIPIVWLLVSNLWFLISKQEFMGEVQVIPASTSLTGGGGGLGNAFSSSLGSLISGGSGNDPIFSIYTESWMAPWFAEEVLKNQPLTRQMFPGRWRGPQEGWGKPGGGIRPLIRTMFGARQPTSNEPNVQMVLDYTAGHIRIQHNRGEVITLVVMNDNNPQFIRSFLSFGHQKIADHIRQVYQKRAQGSIANILNELQHVTVSEYRTTLLQELADQEKIRMMAYANDQFAAQSLGLYVSEAPIWPRGAIVIAASLLISILIYFALALGAEHRNWSRLWLLAKSN